MFNDLNIRNLIFFILIALCAAVILAPAFLWDSMGLSSLWLLLLLVPIGSVLVYIYLKSHREELLRKLRKQWGQKQERKRNYKEIEKLFKHRNVERVGRFSIDDQTWEDLNMGQVFSAMDRTFTTPGEQVLYDMLRTPEFNTDTLKSRGEVIKLFENEQGTREQVEIRLNALGRQKEGNTEHLLYEDIPPKSPFRPLFYVTATAALVSILSIFYFGLGPILILVLLIFGINFFMNYRIKKSILRELSSARYLAAIINTAAKIGRIENPGLKAYTSELSRLSTSCSRILKKIGKLVPLQSNDLVSAVYEYINILFLIEVRSFYSAIGEIEKHIDELKSMYILLGELDTMLSVASFRSSISCYTEPEFIYDNASIYMTDGYHPLLESPVSNSITIKQEGIIITGCNMSGKSTFLRTLGVNALFAQTIYTCLASSYRGSFLRVMTSISRGDNLVGGKSYYLAEAEALLRILKTSDNKVPCLCIVDEMFRGTNSLERINASAEILRYLVNHNCVVVIATHDYELTEMVGNLYKCYYFSENIEKNGISFDYSIKEGVSRMRNAVRLMEHLGYPAEIIESINMRVKDLVS